MKITISAIVIAIILGITFASNSEAYDEIRRAQKQSARRAVDNSCRQKLEQIRRQLQRDPRNEYLNWQYNQMQSRCRKEVRTRSLRR
jgi:hypothetical protein